MGLTTLVGSSWIRVGTVIVVIAGLIMLSTFIRRPVASPSASTGSDASVAAVTPPVAPKLQSTVVIDPATSEWSSFDNNSAGFSLRFPNNWTPKAVDANTTEFRETGKTYALDGKDVSGITVKTESKTGDKSVKAIAAEKYPKAKLTDLTVSGYTALRAEDGSNIAVFYANSASIISISTPKGINNPTVTTIFGQMANSLVFSIN